MDMDFEKLKDVLPNITINTTAAREHVGEIERKIQVIKERARVTMITLPYLALPKIMIIKLMHFCILWLNSFPVKSGVSEKWSPREQISCHWLDAKLHCKTPLGAYCEMHTDPDITNTMESRTKWGICMGPTGKLQRSYKFMSLTTGKKIARCKFTEMPMTEAVMKQIKKWAMKHHAQNGLTLRNRNGEKYELNDNKEDTPIAHPKNALFPDIPAEAPGILTKQEETYGVNAIQEEAVQNNEEQALLAAENSGLKLGVVNIPEWHEDIELLNVNDKNVLNNIIQDDVAIKIKKMQDDDTRKVVEDEAEIKEPEQPSEQSSGAIRKSSRERVLTKRYEDYELYVIVAEEEEFLVATNGDKPDDEDDGDVSNKGNHAEMDDKALSAVAY